MKISIYGAGYVGLISSTCFAFIGHDVFCYDIDQKKIKKLNEGISVLFEDNLEVLLKSVAEKKKIFFTDDFEAAVNHSYIHLICVGTPSEHDGSANLSYLFASVDELASCVKGDYFLVIIKSTVPVGTGQKVEDRIQNILLKRNIQPNFDVVACPEFIAQGEDVFSFLYPDRIIIGTESDQAFEKTKELYQPILSLKNPPIIKMSRNSAELAKYASNLFLATKISFMNEISRIAEVTGADVRQVIEGVTKDKRIGTAMSKPGVGFGGSCLQKDLKALIHQSISSKYTPILLSSVLKVNEQQRIYFIDKILASFKNDIKDKIIGVWGLSFKPNTDDIRNSVSIDLIDALLKNRAKVQAYDAVAGNNTLKLFNHDSSFVICKTKEEAIKNADALVVVTDWQEFLDFNHEKIKKLMKTPILFDGRNMYNEKNMRDAGFTYFSIGAGSSQTRETSK